MSADSHSAAFVFLSLPLLGYSLFGTAPFSNVLSFYEIDLKSALFAIWPYFTIKDNEINFFSISTDLSNPNHVVSRKASRVVPLTT